MVSVSVYRVPRSQLPTCCFARTPALRVPAPAGPWAARGPATAPPGDCRVRWWPLTRDGPPAMPTLIV